MHAVSGVLQLAGPRRTLVEGHADVGPDAALGVHHVLGREEVAAAIDVALELHAFLGDLADVAEGMHLKAAAVGEDGAVPASLFVAHHVHCAPAC